VSKDKNARKVKADSVRALSRGLAVLRHINRKGVCKAGEIARDLGLPRPTVYRLLHTLEEEGYVAYSPSSNRVRVTPLAASLGDGFAMTSQICQAAGPVFARYAPEIIWPLDLSIHENAAMVVQETTHDRSPLSIDRGMIGSRLPMLRSSAGRCYLGLCPPAERDLIIEQIRRLADPEDHPYLHDTYLQPMLEAVSARNLATREGAEFRADTASYAVPVWFAGKIVACISVIWIRSALKLNEALEATEPTLRKVSAEISASLEV